MTAGVPDTTKHRQIMYLVDFAHPLTDRFDGDLFEGEYRDHEGGVIGRVLHRRNDPRPTRGLVVPDESVPLVHVESALDADHGIDSFAMVIALAYGPGEDPPDGVADTGDRWDIGAVHVYLFEDDEAAALARETTS